MGAQTQIGSTYNFRGYGFEATDVGNAAGTLTVGQSGAVDYVMPYDGSVIGVTFRGSGTVGGTLTTGTLTPLVMINGSAAAPFPTANVGIMPSQRGGYYTQDKQKSGYRFTAGQSLGLVYDKAGTVGPTSALDITAEVIVLFENVHY
jgi:hypothetical protein